MGQLFVRDPLYGVSPMPRKAFDSLMRKLVRIPKTELPTASKPAKKKTKRR
jgi:hypothetical protein